MQLIIKTCHAAFSFEPLPTNCANYQRGSRAFCQNNFEIPQQNRVKSKNKILGTWLIWSKLFFQSFQA